GFKAMIDAITMTNSGKPIGRWVDEIQAAPFMSVTWRTSQESSYDTHARVAQPVRAQRTIPPEISVRGALIQVLSSVSSEATAGPMSSATPARPSAVTLVMKSGSFKTARPAKPQHDRRLAQSACCDRGQACRPHG